MNRDERQGLVRDWINRVFGPVLVSPADPLERARRVLEEALELYQSVGGKEADVPVLVQRTFSRPVGQWQEELGQLGVTLLAFNNEPVDMLERMEVRKLLNKPTDYYTLRMAKKILAMPQFYLASEQTAAQKFINASSGASKCE